MNTIGGRDVAMAYDPKYESVGAWYDDGGTPIKTIPRPGLAGRAALA